jgi:hypothetical protein
MAITRIGSPGIEERIPVPGIIIVRGQFLPLLPEAECSGIDNGISIAMLTDRTFLLTGNRSHDS